jgi:hypothetical protein
MATGFNIHDQWLGDVMPQSGVSVALGRNTADGQPAVPVIELNSRLLMLHDTLGSGVLSYNSDALRLELTPTGPAPSGMQPVVTAVYFDAYDSVGGQGLSVISTTVNLDVERANSHPEIFSLSSDILTIKMRGVYEFEFSFGCTTTGAIRSTGIGSIGRRPGIGFFQTIDGSEARQYTRNQTTTSSVSQKLILDDVHEGDEFQVNVVLTGSIANTTTLVDATSLTVRKLA